MNVIATHQPEMLWTWRGDSTLPFPDSLVTPPTHTQACQPWIAQVWSKAWQSSVARCVMIRHASTGFHRTHAASILARGGRTQSNCPIWIVRSSRAEVYERLYLCMSSLYYSRCCQKSQARSSTSYLTPDTQLGSEARSGEGGSNWFICTSDR